MRRGLAESLFRLGAAFSIATLPAGCALPDQGNGNGDNTIIQRGENTISAEFRFEDLNSILQHIDGLCRSGCKLAKARNENVERVSISTGNGSTLTIDREDQFLTVYLGNQLVAAGSQTSLNRETEIVLQALRASNDVSWGTLPEETSSSPADRQINIASADFASHFDVSGQQWLNLIKEEVQEDEIMREHWAPLVSDAQARDAAMNAVGAALMESATQRENLIEGITEASTALVNVQIIRLAEICKQNLDTCAGSTVQGNGVDYLLFKIKLPDGSLTEISYENSDSIQQAITTLRDNGISSSIFSEHLSTEAFQALNWMLFAFPRVAHE